MISKHRPLLIVVAGLPGTGKTTLARPISRRVGACYLRVDAIETALARHSGPVSGPEGYAVATEVARSNLLIGQSVVVDAVCPVPESRTVWADLAVEVSAKLVIFETQLADRDEHERRVSARTPDIQGHQVLTWDSVRAHSTTSHGTQSEKAPAFAWKPSTSKTRWRWHSHLCKLRPEGASLNKGR